MLLKNSELLKVKNYLVKFFKLKSMMFRLLNISCLFYLYPPVTRKQL